MYKFSFVKLIRCSGERHGSLKVRCARFGTKIIPGGR